MQLSPEDQRILLAMIWSLKPSDLSLLHVYLHEAGEILIGTTKDSANNVFYSKLRSWGFAIEAGLSTDLSPQSGQALANTKTFTLSQPGKTQIASLMELALKSGEPPGDSIVSAETVQILERYAAEDDAPSQRKLGLLYDKGAGVEQNYTQALAWYQKAAALGDPVAHNNIGVMHFAGFGVPRDLDEARKWFLSAADLGSPGAMDNLGEMYSRGLGVKQDYAEAAKWFSKAADLGHAEARRKLQEIAAKTR